MKKWLATILIGLASLRLIAQRSTELVLAHQPFAVYSAFWPNLHQLLWAEAWGRRPPSEENAAGVLPEPLRAELTADERRAWDAAVAYYDAEIADLHPLFEMRSIRKAMIAAGAEPPAASLEPAHREVLIAAAPVYRKYWWPAHDAANRAWLSDLMSKVASLTRAVPERLARLYDTPWLTSGVRVDVVRVGTREGAFTSIDPPPAHVTISSSAPALQGWAAAEVLFHEASHVLVFPLMDDFTAELRTQRKASPHLWHVALFYLTGEVVREALAERGITYEPYLYKTGLLDRMWPELRGPIETHWKPYVDGQVERNDAVRNVVSAVEGSGMSVAAFFTDIVFGWRAAEVAALIVLVLWASLSIGPVLNLRALLVIAVITAFLALTVRTLTYPAGNVVLHALTAGFILMVARGLVGMVRTRSKTVRVAVAVVAAPLIYVSARGLALVAVWALAGLAD